MMTRQDHAKDKYNFVLYVPEIRHQRFRVTDALMARLVHGQAVCEIELDPLSSSAWLSMDGTRSVLDVARIQSEKTGDDLDEAVRRIVKFTRYIAKRGWIRFKEGDPGLDS